MVSWTVGGHCVFLVEDIGTANVAQHYEKLAKRAEGGVSFGERVRPCIPLSDPRAHSPRRRTHSHNRCSEPLSVLAPNEGDGNNDGSAVETIPVTSPTGGRALLDRAIAQLAPL